MPGTDDWRIPLLELIDVIRTDAWDDQPYELGGNLLCHPTVVSPERAHKLHDVAERVLAAFRSAGIHTSNDGLNRREYRSASQPSGFTTRIPYDLEAESPLAPALAAIRDIESKADTAIRQDIGVSLPMPKKQYLGLLERLLRWNEPRDMDTDPAPSRDAASEPVRGKLKKSEKKAYESYKIAEEKMSPKPTDREAYEWLVDHQEHIEHYSLPSFDNWARYVRTGRKHYGDPKNTPRAGRPGRSIVPPDQNEPPRRND